MDIKIINTSEDLGDFAEKFGLRPDWHEPDEQGINARIRGTSLDNAMGSTMEDIGEDNLYGEFNIVLTEDGVDVAVVNLAMLLSWAAPRMSRAQEHFYGLQPL